jgi:hypothetical protein
VEQKQELAGFRNGTPLMRNIPPLKPRSQPSILTNKTLAKSGRGGKINILCESDFQTVVDCFPVF